MRGAMVFLGKELREIVRTWRLYVVPGILIFFGLASPLIAYVVPDLLTSVMGSSGQGMNIEIPPATTIDAYLQWSKNAMQIALFAIIITAAGAVVAERRDGTAPLVLAKPVSRSAMVVAKVVSNYVLVLVATIVSAVLCIAVTAFIFDMTLLREFASAVALWYLLACLMITVSVLLSVVLKSQAGAAGVALAVYFALSLAALWAPMRDYSPAGLMSLGDRVLAGEADPSVFWPVGTALLAVAALTALACGAFGRQEV